MSGEIWELDFGEVQAFLDETLGGISHEMISFSDVVELMLKGDFATIWNEMRQMATNVLWEEVITSRSFFMQMVLITLFGAFFTVFVSIFQNSQIADIGFYASYMLLITFLVASLTVTMQIGVDVIEAVTSFMNVFIPAFAIAMTIAAGSATAMIYYETIFLLSYGMEYVMCRVIIPLIRVWFILSVVNHISKEDILSKLQQLIRSVCDGTLRILLTVILGIQALQNLVVPYVSGLNANLLQKAVGAIPGIGNSVESVTNVVLGGGNIIKNGVGAAALIFIIILCIVPLIKLGMIYVMFQVTAAIVQPIADGRMVNGIQCGAEVCQFLIRSVFLCGLLFFITIILTCFATGRV